MSNVQNKPSIEAISKLKAEVFPVLIQAGQGYSVEELEELLRETTPWNRCRTKFEADWLLDRYIGALTQIIRIVGTEDGHLLFDSRQAAEKAVALAAKCGISYSAKGCVSGR